MEFLRWTSNLGTLRSRGARSTFLEIVDRFLPELSRSDYDRSMSQRLNYECAQRCLYDAYVKVCIESRIGYRAPLVVSTRDHVIFGAAISLGNGYLAMVL